MFKGLTERDRQAFTPAMLTTTNTYLQDRHVDVNLQGKEGVGTSS